MKTSDELKRISQEIRIEIIDTLKRCGTGHPGGSLSCVELVTALYNNYLQITPESLENPGRDRFILSKGHASLTQYLAMSHLGFFDYQEIHDTFREIDSRFQAHPSMRKTPGIEACTGSLGQGLSIGNGIALGLKASAPEAKVVVLLGDGECQEGQVWEAAMSAVKYKLKNIVAIIDYNKVQLDGPLEDIKGLGDLEARWQAIGWHVKRIDGHNIDQILDALEWTKNQEWPSVIIADTVKGKGVPFMEGKHQYHGAVPAADVMQKEIERMKGQRA
ncbi:MAG: transketolase [Sphaerochaetaceae bacterium]